MPSSDLLVSLVILNRFYLQQPYGFSNTFKVQYFTHKTFLQLLLVKLQKIASCSVKHLNAYSSLVVDLLATSSSARSRADEREEQEESRSYDRRLLYLLLYQRLLLDDLVLEFEGQHVQYVDIAVIGSK